MTYDPYVKKATEYLAPALRLLTVKRINNTEDSVSVFDYDETIRLVADLMAVAVLGMQPNYDDDD